MFEIEVSEELIKWYMDNHIFKPDASFCGKVKCVLAEKCYNSVEFSIKTLEIVNFLKSEKQKWENDLNSKESQEIASKIQDFFKVDASKIISVRIFPLIHSGKGSGGTFCKGEKPLIFLRISDNKFPVSIIWHEYMHYMADLSTSFKKKRDIIMQNIQIPESIKIGARSIIEEGVVYVAEPLIAKRKIIQSKIDIKKLGQYRAWGAFRQQTLNIRKYFSLDDVVNSISGDWEEFCKLYL